MKKISEDGEKGAGRGAVKNDSLSGVRFMWIVSIHLGNLIVHHLH